MAKIANVALTSTLDTWRTNSNIGFDRLSQFAVNNSSLYANTITANTSFTSTGLATLSGRATVGTNLTVSGNTALTGTLGVTGVATLGNGAILGTPASGVVTNLTGTASININGTVGATTATTGAFTSGTFSAASRFDSNLAVGGTPVQATRLSVKQSGTTLLTGMSVEASATDSLLVLYSDGTNFNIRSDYNTTGIYQPIKLWTSGAVAMTIGAGGASAPVTIPGTLAAGNTTITGTLSASGQITGNGGSVTSFVPNLSLSISGFVNSGILGFGGSTFGAKIVRDSSGPDSDLLFLNSHSGAQGFKFYTGATVTNTTLLFGISGAGAVTIPGAASIKSMLAIGSGSSTLAGWHLGNHSAGTPGIWNTTITPGSSNYIIATNSTDSSFNSINGTTALQVAGATVLAATAGAVAVTGTLSATGNLTLSSATAGILMGTAAGYGYIGNSTSAAYLEFDGASHATTPNQAFLRADNYNFKTVSGTTILNASSGAVAVTGATTILKNGGTGATAGLMLNGGGTSTNFNIDFGTPVSNRLWMRQAYSDGAGTINFQYSADGTMASPIDILSVIWGGGITVNGSTVAPGGTAAMSKMKSASSLWTLGLENSNVTTCYGLGIKYTAATPNAAGSEFAYWEDATALRFSVKSNGGINNYSANDTNLSDVRTKKNIELAGNYLDKICAIPVKTFLYKDQTDEFLNLGVIAQDVEAVAPELIDSGGFGDTPEDGVPLKSIYQTDLQYALMKAIQELAAKVAQLEAAQAAPQLEEQP